MPVLVTFQNGHFVSAVRILRWQRQFVAGAQVRVDSASVVRERKRMRVTAISSPSRKQKEGENIVQQIGGRSQHMLAPAKEFGDILSQEA